ncbi:MAG: glucose-1-phosphate adenylyltransferase subunit GlgD [Clostridiales bacterium]|nr:glucose-1-phosphate adenylyltransferase subunit GlgD [Clostridiales bacterium]
MKDVMSIINDTAHKSSLKELTLNRSLLSVPIGGRYRVVDFALSNMSNSGVKNIGILTQSKNRSLIDHVRAGEEWDLVSKRAGLFILPPMRLSDYPNTEDGDIGTYYEHLDYIKRSRQEYVIIYDNDIVCNINLVESVEFHRSSNAEITVLYTLRNKKYSEKCTLIETGDNEQMTDMAIDTENAFSNKEALGIYILNKKTLVEIIENCHARGLKSLEMDGFVKNISKYKIMGFGWIGYYAKINSIRNFFNHNMDLLEPDIWNELFFKNGLIYTKVRDEPPTKYTKESKVKNSIVANGCIIEGMVENSVLFRGVRVAKGAIVRNSIIMQKGIVGEGASLRCAILDKQAKVFAGKQLRGDKHYPVVVEKNSRI